MKKLIPLLLAVGAGAALVAYKIAKDKKTQVAPVEDDLEYDDEIILSDEETVNENADEEVEEVVDEVKDEVEEIVEEVKDEVKEVVEEVVNSLDEVKDEIVEETTDDEKKTDVA